MSSIGNNRVKIINSDGSQSIQKLGVLFPQLESVKKNIKTEKEVLRYYNLVFKNKKQVQKSSSYAGKQHVTKSPGTNKGSTRQKYVDFGYKTETRSAPNNRKGRKALRFMMNITKNKMNKKEKKAMIYSMIYHMLKNAELYSYEKTPTEKTSEVLKNLRNIGYPKLKRYLTDKLKKEKFAPVIVGEEKLEQYFHNYSRCLFLRKSPNYFGIYQGARLRSICIFQKEYLKQIIKRLL